MEAPPLGLWDVAVGANRLAFYASALLAAGLALFALAVRRGGALPALGTAAALNAGLTAILAIGVGGAQMMGGAGGGLLSGRAWSFAAGTTLGLSAALAAPGALLLAAWFLRRSPRGRVPLLVAGVALLTGAFVVTGHAATAPPRWLATPAVALHVLAAAFWFGALAPLHRAAKAESPVAAGRLMQRFSQFASIGVALLVASGLLISWLQLGSLAGILDGPYGTRLQVKLGLFALLLALAAYNKLVLTPRLAAGDDAAAVAMRRSIRVEALLYVGILAAAAALSMAPPPRG